jgi:hypothetical protein
LTTLSGWLITHVLDLLFQVFDFVFQRLSVIFGLACILRLLPIAPRASLTSFIGGSHLISRLGIWLGLGLFGRLDLLGRRLGLFNLRGRCGWFTADGLNVV